MEVTLCFIFFNPKYYQNEIHKTKFAPTLECCMSNISNIFLAQCWRLETSSRPFYDFIKMTISRDLAFFNN